MASQILPKFRGRIVEKSASSLLTLQSKSIQGDQVAMREIDLWWQSMRDCSCRKSLGIDKVAIACTSLDAVNARIFRPRRPTFKVLTMISRDGVNFVNEPNAFRNEVLTQAKELYGLRLLHTEWAWVSEHAHAAFLHCLFSDG